MAFASILSTGIPGLDDVLHGGWPRERMFLVLGHPGTGKTTLGLQFLLEGRAQGETTLYISLSETEDEVRGVAQSHGWNFDGIHIYDLTAAERVLGLQEEQTMFDPSEVEFRQTSQSILAQVEQLRPTRIVFDSLSELALLARDTLGLRRELLMLKQAFMKWGATVLLLSDTTVPDADRQLQSLAHGVLIMEELTPEYGGDRHRLRVQKLRGTRFRGGYHDYIIDTGGLTVYPRLVAAEHWRGFPSEPLCSGLAELDALTGGGLARGSSTLLMGPAGCGKSSLLALYAAAALGQGEKAAVFLFEEGIASFLGRARNIGLPLDEYVESGALKLRQIDPAELSPGQFVHEVRDAVENTGVRYVGIDSLNGYVYAMPQERFLTLHVHELLSYLNQQGVTTVLVLAQHGLVGSMSTPADVTYVADAVLLLRFFEAAGQVRRAISMIKKRGGHHEELIRSFEIQRNGIEVGGPLEDFHGIFTGVPVLAPPSPPIAPARHDG